MKIFGIAVLGALVAMVLGLSANLGTHTAQAEAIDSVAVGCETLGRYVDGDPDDVTLVADFTSACAGISQVDATNLAAALGDEDDELELSDFDGIDLDDNQLEDGLDETDCDPGLACRGTLLMFVFVDDDEPVAFDAPSGLNQSPVDALDAVAATAQDYTCDTAAEDLDCDNTIDDDGDGVVVTRIVDGTGDAGESFTVEAEQADEPDAEVSQEFLITGSADEVSIAAIETVIQTSEDTADCTDEADVTDATDQLGDVDKTVVKATVLDNDDVELTRVAVLFETEDGDIVAIPASEAGDPASEPSFDSGISVNSGTAGIGAFAVVCGGDTTGVAAVSATINDGVVGAEESDEVDITVVGEADAVALTASPAQIACDGTATSTVSATVTDADGNNVANGTTVNFSVVALGTANPINATTTDGVATSTITPLSAATAGVTVIVTAGEAQASIRVDCALPIPTVVAGSPTPRPGVVGPDTGNGGYLGQDSSAGFPAWTLVALALGSLALVSGGLVTRRIGK